LTSGVEWVHPSRCNYPKTRLGSNAKKIRIKTESNGDFVWFVKFANGNPPHANFANDVGDLKHSFANFANPFAKYKDCL
jgi:hypothetical protein